MSNSSKIVNMVKEAIAQAPQQTQQAPRKPETRVQFDSQTESPFVVIFSQRGFAIEDTRLSFETLEDAISKNYTITLSQGQGLVLDAVKMQKILKYKTLY